MTKLHILRDVPTTGQLTILRAPGGASQGAPPTLPASRTNSGELEVFAVTRRPDGALLCCSEAAILPMLCRKAGIDEAAYAACTAGGRFEAPSREIRVIPPRPFRTSNPLAGLSATPKPAVRARSLPEWIRSEVA